MRGKDLATQVQLLGVPQAQQQVQAVAADGIKGGGGALPHGARIQQAFGGYDISNVQAHTGPDAQAASAAMGAEAYAAYHQPPGPKGTFLAAVDPTTKTWFDAHVDPKGGVGSTENAAEPKPEGEG